MPPQSEALGHQQQGCQWQWHLSPGKNTLSSYSRGYLGMGGYYHY